MKRLLISYLFITCAILIAGAQGVSSTISANAETTSMNFIKLNLTAALIKNYSIQYERILTKDFSAALSFRIMPETGIPYKNQIIKWSDFSDPNDKKTLEDQQDVKNEITENLNDADIPMFKYNITTTSNDVKVKFDGSWGGVRFGLSVGVKF
ncbi:MAG: hypothetical protein K0B05_07480 [Bacteroidales bacterium]|nr:hypothetical protein [Bacteroidales bacterium]